MKSSSISDNCLQKEYANGWELKWREESFLIRQVKTDVKGNYESKCYSIQIVHQTSKNAKETQGTVTKHLNQYKTQHKD